jgi:hypothetical protein
VVGGNKKRRMLSMSSSTLRVICEPAVSQDHRFIGVLRIISETKARRDAGEVV